MQHEQNVSHAMPAKWYVDGWQMEDIQDEDWGVRLIEIKGKCLNLLFLESLFFLPAACK